MDDDILRQRRNLIAISTVLILFDFADVKIAAKIAYSMAAATGALALLKSPSPIPSIILGHDTSVGHWIGNVDAPHRSYPGMLHRVVVVPDESCGMLIGDVQLFSDSFAPSYTVVLGYI
ncbi:hypothetical protein ACMFY5_02685 [Pseudomonas sihuiensis]